MRSSSCSPRRGSTLFTLYRIPVILILGLVFSAASLRAQDPVNRPVVVTLEALDRSAMETHPFQNLIDWGEFRIARTGGTNLDLAVHLQISGGTASFGIDYQLVGQYLDEPRVGPGAPVVIPRGLASVRVRLYPIDDEVYEGAESVTVALSRPADGAPAAYEIDPAGATGAFVILDNERAPSGIQITLPREDSEFRTGADVSLEAVATDPSGYINHVEFMAGSRVIGESTILFIREPDPGTPIQHQFVWREAPDGSHRLTARGTSSSGASFTSAPVTITVGPGAILPTVSLGTLQQPEKTSEPCPVCRIVPGVFTLTRTGPTTAPLTVFLGADGTATPGPLFNAVDALNDVNGAVAPGADYEALPLSVTIPSGTNTAYVTVFPFDDQRVEGPEIVRALLDLPPDGARPDYVVNPEASQAMVVIGDDEPGAPEARLDLVAPLDGAQFPLVAPILVTALGVSTQGEVDQGVDFFANGVLIGRTPPLRLARTTLPCLPSAHAIVWTNPVPGRHTLTARSELGLGQFLEAPPIHIVVGEPPPVPVVWIEATRIIAEETSFPFRRVAFRGEFTVSRSGPTRDSTSIFVHFDGTATPGRDYSAPQFLVTIPAGATATTIEIVPQVDDVTEGIETVVARLSHCPPETVPPLGLPCVNSLEIDRARASAIVYIRDDGITRTSVRLVRPASGSAFVPGNRVSIEAEAFDLEGAVGRVEFLANGRRIGETALEFVRPPEPGELHTFSFVWQGADPGDYLLTAIAHNDGGGAVTSAPVAIQIRTGDDRPVVTISAADAFAVEPHRAGEVNTASFRIARSGPTNGSLTVRYSLHGAATHGADYESLPGVVTIPGGRRSVLVTATPVADDLVEGVESVILQLEPAATGNAAAAAYQVGARRRAAALIADQPWVHSPNGARCERLPGGLVHLCFQADGLGNLAIEASEDFLDWETIGEASPSEGALHYVDEGGSVFSHRFYRIRPLPSALAGE